MVTLVTQPLAGQPDRFHGVDALRGIAASLIVVVHSINILPLGPEFRPVGGFDWIFRYFVMGVPLFFIISAFSMSAAYAEGMAGKGALGRYAIRRLCRIVPLFYVMLAAWLGYYHYLGSPPQDAPTLLANLSFTFSLFPATQTSLVPAGWSIGIEMLFYAVFPLLLLLRGAGAALAMLGASLLASWAWNQPMTGDLPGFYYWTHPVTNAPYFALGLLAWRVLPRLQTGDPARAGRLLLGLGVGSVLLMVAYGPSIDRQQTYVLPVSPVLLVGWGFAFFCIVLSQVIRPTAVLVNPVTLFLGRISYSLYLAHPLVIYSTGITVWIATHIAPEWLALALILAAVFAIAIPVAWLLYTLIEAPFIALGRRLTARPQGHPAVPSPAE